MGLLDDLLGGGQQRQSYQDFVGRYDQGPPYQGISDREAMSQYQQVATRLPPDMYQQSAQEAYARMSPQERMQFAQHLQQRTQQYQGFSFPDLEQDRVDDRYQDPRMLAQMTSRMEQQQPGILGQLLGGGGGGGAGSMLDNPLAKAALAGVTAMAVKRMMGGR